MNSHEKLKEARLEAAPNKKETVMTVAQQLIQEGKQSGMKMGIEVGMEQGILTGMDRGKLETAQNMLPKKWAIGLISDITGLSIEKIKALINNYDTLIDTIIKAASKPMRIYHCY